MKTMEGFLTFVKDCLFPVFCLGCRKEGEWLCAECGKSVNIDGVVCCPVCHTSTPGGACCASCAPRSSLAAQIAITPYRETELIGSLVGTLKYQFADDIMPVFRRLIDRFLADQAALFSAVECVAPVPLHPRRYAERGFNQAALLAESVGYCLGLPVLPLLARQRYTAQQATLSREERQKNVRDVFAVHPARASSVRGKTVLLVDDVYTTGSTLQAAAQALCEIGAGSVVGFTVARG